MSNLTAFNYIQERSEATPGLWNAVFSQLSENIATLDFTSGGTTSISSGLSIGNDLWVRGQVISGQDASITTQTLLSLGTNSNVADYIKFSDTSASRSNYIIGSHVGGTADGLNIWDDSAGTMIASFSKQSIRFYQNVVGPVFDVGGALADTLNAATFGTGADSDETRIQAAISAATNAIPIISRIYVPANMYPYSAGSVSFDSRVQMVREGGNWTVFDVRAYGAAANGVQDDAPSFRAALDGASYAGAIVYVPSSRSFYAIGSTITIPDNAGILGESRTRKTNNPLPSGLSRIANVPILAYVGGPQLLPGSDHSQGLVIQNLALYGSFFTSDLVVLKNATNVEFSDVRISRVSGRGLYMDEVFDSNFDHLLFDFCGTSGGTACVYLGFGDTVDPDTSNVIKFFDCTMETNKGRHFHSVGGSASRVSGNHHIWIDRCKFESTTMTHEFVNITNGFNVWIRDSLFIANNPQMASTTSSCIWLGNVDTARIGGFFQTGGSIGTYPKNIVNFIQASGVTQLEVDAWFHIASSHSLAGSAISCSNVSLLDTKRAGWSQNTYGVSMVEGSPGWFHHVGGQHLDAPLSVATSKLWVDSTNSFVGINQVAPTSVLHVVANGLSASSQALLITDQTANLATKAGYLATSHYTIAEEPLLLVRGVSGVGSSLVDIGGGTASYNAATQVRIFTGSDTSTTVGTARISVSSGGTVGFDRPIYVSNDGATTPAFAWSAETQLGFYRSGVSSIAISKGTFNLATNAVRLSMRTLAASSVTASAVNTNVARDEVVFTIGGASGASLIISSGGTAYIFTSTASAILA